MALEVTNSWNDANFPQPEEAARMNTEPFRSNQKDMTQLPDMLQMKEKYFAYFTVFALVESQSAIFVLWMLNTVAGHAHIQSLSLMLPEATSFISK